MNRSERLGPLPRGGYFPQKGTVAGTMNLELAADVQERLAEEFWKLDTEIADETLKLAESFKLAGQAGNLGEFILSHRKKFPFGVQPQTDDLRELLLLHTKRWLTLKMDLIAAEWTKLSLDEREFRSQMDRLEWALAEEAVVKFSVCCRGAGDCTPANELIRYAEKEVRLTLAVRGRGWCRRNQARALVMTIHRGTPRKLEQDTETFSVALRKKTFEPTWADTKPAAKDHPDCVSTADESEPIDQAPGMTGESEADDRAARSEAQAQSEETERTVDNTDRNGAKGDPMLLGDKRLVNFKTAELYLGISERQRQKLISSGALKVEGQGQNRKITTESLKAYLPPEIPN
jgi:hypothetical protein